MRKFPFPRIHGPDHDLCIRSYSNLYFVFVSQVLYRDLLFFVLFKSTPLLETNLAVVEVSVVK